MCLGVPGRVLHVDGLVATVDFWGVRREVRLDVVDEPVGPGDYVLNHVGYAIRRIPDGEIGATLELYELLLREADAEGARQADAEGARQADAARARDAMAEDVRAEIEAARAPAPGRGRDG